MTQHSAHGPSWYAAENVRQWRRESQEGLARRVAELGVPMNRSILANIESHRRQDLTLEEAFALAVALNVSPTNLILPSDETVEVAVTPTLPEFPLIVRSWVYGHSRLPATDDKRLDHEFRSRAPEHELRDRDEAVWRHPLVMALLELRTLARDAILGPQERVDPPLLAEALRRTAKKVAAYAELLADEVDQAASREATDEEER